MKTIKKKLKKRKKKMIFEGIFVKIAKQVKTSLQTD